MDETFLISTSLEELQQLHASLQSAVASNEVIIDSQNQELYSIKREISRLDSLAIHHTQEIENLKLEYAENLKQTDNLREKRLKLSKQRQAKINVVKLKINDIDEEITNIKGNKVEQNKKMNENSISDVIKNNIEELLRLEIKWQNDIEHNSSELQNALQSNRELKTEHNLKTRQLEELQKNLQSLNDNYQRVNEEFQTMKDELVSLKTKLEVQKSKPLGKDVRGNSLFAEVNDRRMQLEKNMQVMKNCYIDMKGEYENLLQRISTLQLENLRLAEEWEHSTHNINIDTEDVHTYKERIANLNVDINSLKMELGESVEEIGLSKIGSMIEVKRRNFREVLENLEQHLKKNIEYHHKQQIQTADMFKSKAESRKLQCEINKLKTDLDFKNCKKLFNKLEEDKENVE